MPVLSDVWCLQGYVVGTYLYFAIVFSLPICMGLAAVAMDLPVSLPLLLLLSRLLVFPVTLCCFHLVPCPALPCPALFHGDLPSLRALDHAVEWCGALLLPAVTIILVILSGGVTRHRCVL